jgi:ammonia channel protein AmtB
MYTKRKKRFLVIVLSSFYVFSFLFAQYGYGFDCKEEQEILKNLTTLQKNNETRMSDEEWDKLEKKIAVQQRFIDTMCPKSSYTGIAARIAVIPMVDNAIVSTVKNLLDIMRHNIFVGQNMQQQRPVARNYVTGVVIGLCLITNGFILFAP